MPTQILSFWQGLEPRQRLVGALSLVAVLVALVGFGRIASSPSMALLYSGLDPVAAGEVVAALEAEGIPFEVRESTILIESSQRDRVRMQLAGQGLPAGGPSGYEILDGLSGFGTTSQMFDAAYWRAKEGELARTITGGRNVRAARVHLANPVSQPFSRTPTGSASVTVTMASGQLDETQAEAIRYLISSAIAGVSPEAVAVIDSTRGVVMQGAEDSLARAGGVSPADRAETLRQNIIRLLEARVGPGRAIVEVNVDANLDSQTITERIIDPDSRVAISSETEENKENSEGSDPGVTVASNLPDGDAGAGPGQNTSNSSSVRERSNFEVSETRTERVILPGQVRRINVAVMIDGILVPADDGAMAWEPRPEPEMETLRQLVQTAAGFDAERGDTVTIESLQFTAPPEQGMLAERGGIGFLDLHGARLAQLGILAVIVLALIFFVLRPMTSRRPAPDMARLTGTASFGGPMAALEQDPFTIGKSNDGTILDLPPQTLSKIDRLREVISSRSDDSAAVLKNWIEAPEPRKELTSS